MAAYRTGGGGLSLRTLDRPRHFEVEDLGIQGSRLVLHGSLADDGAHRLAARLFLEGTGRGSGVRADVPIEVLGEPGEPGGLTLAVDLEALRLCEYAPRSQFRPWLRDSRGARVDLGALLAGPAAARRLGRGVEGWVPDPLEGGVLVEEHPSPDRFVRARIADSGDLQVTVVGAGA